MRLSPRLIVNFAIVGSALALFVYVLWHDPVQKSVPVGDEGGSLNNYILAAMDEYPTDGSLKRLPVGDQAKSLGLTKDIYYLGERIFRGDAERRSYCCGLMFEVYLDACGKYSSGQYVLAGMQRGEILKFRKEFYGVDGNKETFVHALTTRGLGRRVEGIDDAQKGDLIQFWRNNGSGHSAVFLSYDRAGSTVTFWSVHSGKGISLKTESINSTPAGIRSDQVYVVRATTERVSRK